MRTKLYTGILRDLTNKDCIYILACWIRFEKVCDLYIRWLEGFLFAADEIGSIV
jgi:hypothetical protein